MTTRDELQAIMDRPGFGTGRAFRDRNAQENEALARRGLKALPCMAI